MVLLLNQCLALLLRRTEICWRRLFIPDLILGEFTHQQILGKLGFPTIFQSSVGPASLLRLMGTSWLRQSMVVEFTPQQTRADCGAKQALPQTIGVASHHQRMAIFWRRRWEPMVRFMFRLILGPLGSNPPLQPIIFGHPLLLLRMEAN